MITASELNQDAASSIDIDLSSSQIDPITGISYKELAERSISDAQGYIETFLDRKLSVQPYTDYIVSNDWEYNEAREKYTVFAQQYPITDVTTPGVDSNKNMFIADEMKKKVEYSAGYATLPGDIRRCMSNIALYLVLTSYNNLIPYQSTEKNIGGVNSVITKDSMYIERELKKIEGYQRLQ